jgi:hypothetical protein
MINKLTQIETTPEHSEIIIKSLESAGFDLTFQKETNNRVLIIMKKK